MIESVFASKSEVGQRYVTTKGWPVTVLDIGTRVSVRNDFSGETHKLFSGDLLWPYDKGRITKEAMDMAKISKASKRSGNGFKGGERGAVKEASGIGLFRVIGTTRHTVLCNDGVLLYRGKKFAGLKDVAEAIRGKAISGSGRSFFGLRKAGNIELGKEVIKQLKLKKSKVPAAVKPSKAKGKKEDDDEGDGEIKNVADSVGGVVAKVFGKGRK